MQASLATETPDAVINRECRRIMEVATAQGFLKQQQWLSQRLNPQEQSAASELEAALPDWRDATGGLERFRNLTEAFRPRYDRSTFHNINKLLIVNLALRLEESIASRSIPDEILLMYPAASQRLLNYLVNLSDSEYSLPNDEFLKDLRFTSGLSVPSGSHVIDLRSMIGYRASARLLLHDPSWRYVRSIMRSGQIVPWCRVHTEARYLDTFNEAGWDATYLRVAALLRLHTELLGLAGTSWFYDPQLDQVSPRLTYLRLRLLERGAALFWGGTTDFDIRSATAKSESRRLLYEAGRYTPTGYTILWPRDKLLAWAAVEVEKRS